MLAPAIPSHYVLPLCLQHSQTHPRVDIALTQEFHADVMDMGGARRRDVGLVTAEIEDQQFGHHILAITSPAWSFDVSSPRQCGIGTRLQLAEVVIY